MSRNLIQGIGCSISTFTANSQFGGAAACALFLSVETFEGESNASRRQPLSDCSYSPHNEPVGTRNRLLTLSPNSIPEEETASSNANGGAFEMSSRCGALRACNLHLLTQPFTVMSDVKYQMHLDSPYPLTA